MGPAKIPAGVQREGRARWLCRGFLLACVKVLEQGMNKTKRILLAVGILLVDLFIFFLPLTALFLIYIIVFNPPWFRDFLNHLDQVPE
jgi:hypothetical protein